MLALIFAPSMCRTLAAMDAESRRELMQDAGGIDEHISADCRIRAVIKLRAELPGSPRRGCRVAVPAPPGLPERFCCIARSDRRGFPVRAKDHSRGATAPISARNDGAGDHVAG